MCFCMSFGTESFDGFVMGKVHRDLGVDPIRSPIVMNGSQLLRSFDEQHRAEQGWRGQL